MFLAGLKNRNNQKKIDLVSPFFSKNESVLDFGCGDLSFASSLLASNPYLSISGIDISDLRNIPENFKFIRYDGDRLPFKNKSFDTVISFYVFHHCKRPEISFSECVRVARKRVVVIESVRRHKLELPFMGVLDWALNIWKPDQSPITFQFFSLMEWRKIFQKYRVKIKTSKKSRIAPQPFFLPFGSTYLFELIKHD